MLILQNRLQHITSTAPPPVNPPKTFPVGHWIFPLGGADSHADISSQYTTNVRGFLKRIPWKSLEAGGGGSPVGTNPGTYDFSEITSDLAYAAAHVPPLYVAVLIEDKSYSGGENMLPAYLDTDTWTNQFSTPMIGYEFPNGTGKSPIRWKQRYIDRYNALTTAIGAQFDNPTVGNNRYFIGIATQETAVGSSVTVPTYDYTATAYKNSYQSVLQSASASLSHSYVFWIFNFFTGNQSFMTTVAQFFSNPANCPALNVMAGGPDMKPWDGTLNGPGDAFTQYEAIRTAGSGTNMFCVFSDPCYDGRAIGAGPNPPRPHKTVNVYSTIAATTALQVSATAIVGGKLQITVPCTNAQSVTGVNPYSVDEIVQLDDGTNQVDVTVQSISGSSGSYKAVFTTNPAPPSGSWVGSTASRYWVFNEYYVWAQGLSTGTPDFPAHAVIHLTTIFWYPTGSTIYDYDNGTSPGGTDAKSFINAHPTIWP